MESVQFEWMAYCGLAFLFWGLWAFLPKLALGPLNATSVFVYEMLGAALVEIIILSTTGLPQWQPQGATFALSSGIAVSLGTFFYFKALEKGSLTPTVMITSLYPLLAIFLAVLFLYQAISIRQLLGIGCAVVALLLLIVE